jgi:hypothetical protein
MSVFHIILAAVVIGILLLRQPGEACLPDRVRHQRLHYRQLQKTLSAAAWIAKATNEFQFQKPANKKARASVAYAVALAAIHYGHCKRNLLH